MQSAADTDGASLWSGKDISSRHTDELTCPDCTKAPEKQK